MRKELEEGGEQPQTPAGQWAARLLVKAWQLEMRQLFNFLFFFLNINALEGINLVLSVLVLFVLCNFFEINQVSLPL